MTVSALTAEITSRMQFIETNRGDVLYPVALTNYLGDAAPSTLNTIGDLDILNLRLLGLFCSSRCPGNIIVKTYDLMQSLRETCVPLISPFHSPVERECLRILLKGENPVVIYLARSLTRMRMPLTYRAPLAEGRLLLMSDCGVKQHRANRKTAMMRNTAVCSIASEVLVSHAEVGGGTEAICQKIISMRKPLYALGSSHNEHLFSLGATMVTPQTFLRHYDQNSLRYREDTRQQMAARQGLL